MKNFLLFIALFIFVSSVHALPICKGNDSRRWNNCYSKQYYPPNDYFIGEFKQGKRHWRNGVYVKNTPYTRSISASSKSHGQGGLFFSMRINKGELEFTYDHGQSGSVAYEYFPFSNFRSKVRDLDRILRKINVSGEYFYEEIEDFVKTFYTIARQDDICYPWNRLVCVICAGCKT